ncbi:hypothetical protein ABZW18_31045 [Streptomyces sp. NPDC004647]|uniref:hypothetical protein n=1 Tax=Streptomyces sp. NPDC004647 TaxID=3154671 RepID=UPI0033A518C0
MAIPPRATAQTKTAAIELSELRGALNSAGIVPPSPAPDPPSSELGLLELGRVNVAPARTLAEARRSQA